MDVRRRFEQALATGDHDDHPDRLPGRLVRAVAAVLPVDGVGLGVHGEPHHRTPLAASTPAAAMVERLQFTIGAGPCLHAVQSVRPVLATGDRLAREWPVFHEQMTSRTPVRSMLALPLLGPLRGLGCLSLYSDQPEGAAAVSSAEAAVVAGCVTEELGGAADWSAWAASGTPPTLDTPDARRRGRMWMAVGMVMLAQRKDATDVLSLLRASAWSSGRTLDDLVDDLVERRIPAHDLPGAA